MAEGAVVHARHRLRADDAVAALGDHEDPMIDEGIPQGIAWLRSLEHP